MDQHSSDRRPGDAIAPCTEAPTLRARDPEYPAEDLPERGLGYTSRGHVEHFLPDREVNLAKLNAALADVYGEPALRVLGMQLEIDPEFWRQVCGDPWSGNLYRYAFRLPGFDPQVKFRELDGDAGPG